MDMKQRNGCIARHFRCYMSQMKDLKLCIKNLKKDNEDKTRSIVGGGGGGGATGGGGGGGGGSKTVRHLSNHYSARHNPKN